MLFNSLRFLYLFLPVAWLVFWKLTTRLQRYIWLTLTGYVFYSFWNYKFCALMGLSTAVSYLAGLGFLRFEGSRQRKLCLVLPIVIDLTLLAIFKYADFTLSTFQDLGRMLHLSLNLPRLQFILPVGISFYTFHTITYIVDCYRGIIRPTRNFFEFSTYVSLFPQLVAGPIVRFREIESDLEQIDRHDARKLHESGWSFFALGMIKKVLIADTLAGVINPALENWQQLSTAGAWLCMLGYSYQLYFDFSGYSDMAVGLGRLFGLRLPQNFNSPYKALDIADFWRRWHMSLSSVLRDYLYIPLGGSRKGAIGTHRNLIITMLLGGLWHGANWTFVCWGAYHGVLLSLTRVFAPWVDQVPEWLRPKWLRMGFTFLLVVVGWVLFRASSFDMARVILGRMFSWHGAELPVGWRMLLPALAVSAMVAHGGPNTFELSHRWSRSAVLAIAILFAACMAMIYEGSASPFLYFQF